MLGIGQKGLVAVKTDSNNRIVPEALKEKIVELKQQGINHSQLLVLRGQQRQAILIHFAPSPRFAHKKGVTSTLTQLGAVPL
ncbi:hypothetical protein JCM19233_3011 [Vibrio astriarenae]|nr:hypothetical protein JCM19233_3011 [Vibrio sp. C7]